jgi:hypothetical protein
MFVAAGRLGIDEGNDLTAMEVKLIEAHAIVEMEADLAVTERTIRERPPLLDVTVTAGLPELPGTNITMPPWCPAPS